MANRIKGLTIEIEGNTTKLSDSLDKVNKSLKTTQKDLNDVNKLLKLDPKNTELLSQKQELLNSKIKDTEDKLKQEKEAMQALKDAPQTQENIEKQQILSREISETESQLKKAKEQAKEFGSVFAQQMKETGKEVQKVGEDIKSVGDNMTKYITAPIVALGGASLASFTQLDKGLDIVVQKTGATGENLEDLEQVFKNVGKDVPSDWETIGTAVGEVNTRFGLVGDELEGLSEKFIKFADLNGTDVNNAIDSTQKIMSAYGLSIDDVGNMLDVFNKVGQNTGVSMETIQSGVLNNATAFQQLGLSAEEGAILIGQLEMSGADVSTVMGGLSKALKSATADGKPLDTVLTELQDTIANSKDETEGLQQAYDLFGKSGAQVYQAVKDGSLSFDGLAESVGEVANSVNGTYETTKSPMENMQTILNQLMTVGYDIATSIMPLIQSAMDAIVPLVEKLSNAWNGLSPEMQEFVVKGALILAVLGPIISSIGGLVIGVGQLMTFAPVLIGAIAPFAPVLLGIVAGISAVVAIGVVLYKNWDTIKEKAISLWTSIKTTFDNIKTKIQTVVQAIKNAFNFKWSLPHIKLPHFSISGSANPIDWIKEGVPKFSVSWYKKAMNNPVVFTSPTVLATNSGLKGFGESGAEVVMSLNKLQQMVGANGQSPIVNMTINGAQGQNVNELADVVAQRLTTILSRQNGRW